MPLEHPYQFNGLSLHDQSQRPGAPAGGGLFGLGRVIETRETRSQRSEIRSLGRSDIANADGTTGYTIYEAAGLIVVAPGKFFNNARPAPPTANGVEDGGDLFEDSGGDSPRSLFDTQQAANYSAAANSTIGILASDIGATVGLSYDMLFSYTLAVAAAKTPRIGWHNTPGGATPGNVNTHTPLVKDPSGVLTSGIHQAADGSGGDFFINLWPSLTDQMFFRLFCVTAPSAGEGIYLNNIFLFNNYGYDCVRYFSGQGVDPFPATPRADITENQTDALAFDLQHTGTDNPPQDITGDKQHTATPDYTESSGNSGDPNMGAARPTVLPGAPSDDRNLLHTQFLVSARTTDTDAIFSRGRFGRIALKLNGGAWVDQMSALFQGYALWFCPTVMTTQLDAPYTLTDAVDFAAYLPLHAIPDGTITPGAEVRYEMIAAVRPELDAPSDLTGDVDVSKGPGQADIDGLVTFTFHTTYPLLYDVTLWGRVPDGTDGFTQFFELDYNGAGDWSTDLVYDAVADAGSMTFEVYAFYDNPEAPFQVRPPDTGPYISMAQEAPSPAVTAAFAVGSGDPPADPVITNCPSGPLLQTQYLFTWTEGTFPGATATDHYTYWLDSDTPTETTDLSVQLTGVAIGQHTFHLEAWDAVGDHSAIITCTFTIDSPSSGGPVATVRDGCGVSDLAWGSLDGTDWWVRVKNVNGIWDADVRDERYPKPGQSGERSVNDFYGGKPITVTGEVRARTLTALRQGQRAVQEAFGDLGMHRFYFQSKIDAGYYYVCARKIQPIDMVEEQTTMGWVRSFTVALRGDDPRAYSLDLHHAVLTIGAVSGASGGHLREYGIASSVSLGGTNPLSYRAYDQPTNPKTRVYGTPGVAGGARTTIVNAGTAETYPLSVIHGPISGGLVYANLTTGEELVWTNGLTLGDTDTLVVDHGFDEITRNGQAVLDFQGFDALHSIFWPLEPGDNELAVLPFSSGAGAQIDIYWRDALR